MWKGLTSERSRRWRRPGSAFAPASGLAAGGSSPAGVAAGGSSPAGVAGSFAPAEAPGPGSRGGEPVGARADWPQPLPFCRHID